MADEIPVKFPSSRQPVWTRDQTGFPVFTRPWFLFFQNMWLRQGGGSAPGLPEVLEDFLQSPGVFEQVAQQDVFEQLLGEVSQLREEVAELTKELNDLRQGSLI